MAPPADADDPYLLDLMAELNATKKALGDVFGRELQEPITFGAQRSWQLPEWQRDSQLQLQPKGLLLQTPTLMGKMSQFGRQSGGDSEDDSPISPPRATLGASASPSWREVSPPSLRDSPSSYGYGWDMDGSYVHHHDIYDIHDSDLERDTASSSGFWPMGPRSHSPPKSAIFQPMEAMSERRLTKRGSPLKDSEALGEAAGCLVSGIYLVSARGAVSKMAPGNPGKKEREDETLEDPPVQDIQDIQDIQDAQLDQGSVEMLQTVAPVDGMGQSVAQPDVLEMAEDHLISPADDSEDFDAVPSGAFVLQTPRKYRIGRPPCMFGRSHVNILAHPDRFRFWSDHRSALSPLAFALCSQAASGYRKLQLNRLFLASATSSHSDPPGFMVLTGRWNRCLEDSEDHNDWKVDSPPRRSQHHGHHALEDAPEFTSMNSQLESVEAPLPGVGAFFEEHFPASPVPLEMKASPVYQEEKSVLASCPKRPEPVKGCPCDWCLKYCRRYSRKQLLLFLVAVVLCLGLVACLSYLIMVLFRVGPYRCSHEETPFTPDDCTRQLRGGFGFV